MMKHESFRGIDIFRIIAALMVIGIHTSPLASFSDTGDFLLTRVISRTAVPFFMMTTGFFTLSHYAKNTLPLQKFIRKTAIIYAAAVLLYLPVNIYNGYFANEHILANIIGDVVINGTMYHLWYFPASITGCAIGWYLIRRLGEKGALAITFLLYLVGLFGDSYWGVTENIPALKNIYLAIFEISHYTRNGLFYAPLFFVIGGCISEAVKRNKLKLSVIKRICCTSICLILMIAEALTLKHLRTMRHDSMYIFLPFCAYFIFTSLLCIKGRRIKILRSASMVVYIIHPLVIAAMRPAARLLHLPLLIENSLTYYFAVSAASILIAFTFAFIQKKLKTNLPSPGTDRAWIEIDTDALKHNVTFLRSLMTTQCELMAVIKDEAYGHGSFEIAVNLERLGVKAFAVATIDEGIRLRKYGIRGEILILGYTKADRAIEIRKYNLMQTLTDMEYATDLNRQGIPVKVHIKIDTGMHRLGFSCENEGKISSLFLMEKLKICGIYTHLCCSDSQSPEDVEFTHLQSDRFFSFINKLRKIGAKVPKIHIQSSYGLLNYPELKCDYVRIGIALYGVLSNPDKNTVISANLKPVLSLKARIILIRQLKKGESVGYGRSYTAKKDMRIAVISVGYGDGFPRNLSDGKASIYIGEHKCTVIGRICMDQLTVDITNAKCVSVGDTATLIGGDCSASLTANAAETISNELLCRIGSRLPIIEK